MSESVKMELLDPRIKTKKCGPFGVPMVYDWNVVNSIYPQGNTLSRRIKQMYFDTRGLIVQPPESREWSELSPNSCGAPPKEMKIQKSHTSIYELDFNGPQWHNYHRFRQNRLPKPRLEQIPIERMPGRPNIINSLQSLGTKVNEQAFLQWNIPKDIWDEKPIAKEAKKSAKIGRCKTTLPESKPPQKEATRRSKSVLEKKLPTTNDLLGDLNVSERRILLKSIILNEWNGESETLNKIMSPDAKRVAQKWLQRAKPRDKDFAMALFHKFAGNKRLSLDDHQIRQLINCQRNNGEEPKWELGQSLKPGFSKKSGENQLQYINLLKSKERQDQWSHCTWHHLPVYRELSRGEHSGAMFQSLHKPQPVEYVLHPEIG